MQKGTLTTLRPAEEIAREMVPEPCEKDGRGQILVELRDPGSTRGTVWPIFAWPGEVDDLRAFIARAITQARADGAAAALAGQQPPDPAPEATHRRRVTEEEWTATHTSCACQHWDECYRQGGDDVQRCDCACHFRIGAVISTSNGPLALDPVAMRGEPIVITGVSALDDPEDGYTHAVSYYGPSGIAGSALVTAEDAARVDGLRGRAGEQPRDLAGRIRGLIQEYAGRWADAEPRSIERRAATGVMDDLCRALDDVRTGTGRPLTWWIELFRHPGGSMDPTIRAHRSLAADELEAIVRECAERDAR